MRYKHLLTIAVAAGLSAAPVFAADDTGTLLERELGDKPPAKAEEKKPPAPPIRPDAVRAVDDKDLTEKLTGKGNDKSNPMAEVLERMGTVAERLAKRDPGAETQETERRIVLNLDELIELAKQQQQSSSSQQSGQPKQGQQRQQPQGQKPGSQQGDSNQGGNNAAQQSKLTPGSAQRPEKNQDIHEGRTEWGNLPPATRDLIVNGAQEETLPAYKKQVDDYYRALADLGKTTRDEK